VSNLHPSFSDCTVLLSSRGRPDDARNLLAPVYSWFTKAFDTLDLEQAKALLDELALRGR